MRYSRYKNTKKREENHLKFKSFVGSKLSSFPYLPPTSKFEEINISDNNLVSFKGMVELQNLVTLRCENTKISSFLGAKPLPSLKKLFIGNSPLSHYAYHRIMAAIVFGDSLETVDFVKITKPERLFAINNRELLFQFLIEGWVMTITDPIKLFHVETRQRRILFPAPVFPSPNSSALGSPVKSPTKKALSSPTGSQKFVPYQPKFIDIINVKRNLLLMRRLHSILFERTGSKSIYKRSYDDFFFDEDQQNSKNEELVSSIEPLLINDEAYFIFIKMILMAVNARPLHIKEIVHFLSLFKTEKIVALLMHHIPLFGFFSYPIIASFLENLLDQNILAIEDIKPFFFPVYEHFEDWNSSFVLFESKSNLSVSFISFFCIFSDVIQKVDNELFDTLKSQLGEKEKDTYESFMKIHETRESTIKTLLSDDIVSYAALSESNVIQNIIDYTPWSITANVKSAAAAFSGSEYCFLQYSLKGENFNVLFETHDEQENSDEEEEILKQNLIDIKNEDEVLYFAIAGGNNNIVQKFKRDESEILADYTSTAIQYHRVNTLNQIFTRVTNSKYFKFDDSFFDSDFEDSDDDYLLHEEEEKNEDIVLISKFTKFYSIAAENLDYCTLMFFAKKRVPFDNGALNSVISNADISTDQPNFDYHTNAFMVHYLLNLGFCTDDCLFLSVQNRNIDVTKVIINRFDSHKYDVVTDETKVICFRSEEKRRILGKISNFKGDVNFHWTPLQLATCTGILEMVELLALRDEVNVNEQDDEGNTALAIAVSNKFTSIVKFLAKLQKVNTNLSDNKGWSPLSVAVGNNYVEIVKILINNLNTHVNCKTKDEGATPLMIAVDTDNFEAFKLLLTRDDINVNSVSNDNKTAMSMAIENERVRFVQTLIETNKVDFSIGNTADSANQSTNEEIRSILNDFV